MSSKAHASESINGVEAHLRASRILWQPREIVEKSRRAEG